MVKPLLDLTIGATSLTSEGLHASFLEGETPWDTSINDGLSSLEAARVAFRMSRFHYHLLIVQMASWWRRLIQGDKTKVIVHHCKLIDVISSFAAFLPELPEFD